MEPLSSPIITGHRSIRPSRPTQTFGGSRLSADQVDALVNVAEDLGDGRYGVEELLSRMTQPVLERALETEMSDHLGYESGTLPAPGRATSATARPASPC